MRTIGGVTGQIALSQKRFIQVFHEEVGMTPKLFCRVRRFRRIHRAGRVDWAQTALDCGYYDQAHFINDFRAFSGLSPTAYLDQRSDQPNHVPLEV